MYYLVQRYRSVYVAVACIALLVLLCTWVALTWWMLLTCLMLNPSATASPVALSLTEQMIDSFFGGPGMYMMTFLNIAVCTYGIVRRIQEGEHPFVVLGEQIMANIFVTVLFGMLILGRGLVNLSGLMPPSAFKAWLQPFNWLIIGPMLTLWLYFWVAQIWGFAAVKRRLWR